MATTRNTPARSEAFLNPRSSELSAKVTVTGRFSHTAWFARSSAARTCSAANAGVARSMVELSAPKWTLTVAIPNSSAITADSRCCPVCCCM